MYDIIRHNLTLSEIIRHYQTLFVTISKELVVVKHGKTCFFYCPPGCLSRSTLKPHLWKFVSNLVNSLWSRWWIGQNFRKAMTKLRSFFMVFHYWLFLYPNFIDIYESEKQSILYISRPLKYLHRLNFDRIWRFTAFDFITNLHFPNHYFPDSQGEWHLWTQMKLELTNTHTRENEKCIDYDSDF